MVSESEWRGEKAFSWGKKEGESQKKLSKLVLSAVPRSLVFCEFPVEGATLTCAVFPIAVSNLIQKRKRKLSSNSKFLHITYSLLLLEYAESQSQEGIIRIGIG